MKQTSGSRHPCLWGDPASAVGADDVQGLAELVADRFPGAQPVWTDPVDWREVRLPAARLTVPGALEPIAHGDTYNRLLHAVGRSYRDLVRARRGDYMPVPDVVATPRSAHEVTAVLEWCADAGAACVPFGGGTSVVGGVNPPAGDRPVVTLQLRAMDRVLDVDGVSQAAQIQAGASGPVLEEQLGAHGLTLRFYPQSFEYSTLGGWIATRAGGHFATGPTHIDDLVQAVGAETPSGRWESRRLPSSAAGPSPDAMLLGSEGTLGVVTDAWVRVQPRPRHRAGRSVRFDTFRHGTQAVRMLTQSGLAPAGCRVLDPTEALLNGVGDGTSAVLVLTFESVGPPVNTDLAHALELCRDAGGDVAEATDGPDETASQWKGSFIRAPYLRDALIGLGLVVETFETATTWDRLDDTVQQIIDATRAAVTQVCGDGIVTCRITHAYRDGAAPYFTVLAPARPGGEIDQWDAVKAGASEAIMAAGATITHHHAIGRDHRPWYDHQRPGPFATAIQAAKSALDPEHILNPGVLLAAEHPPAP